MTIPGYPTRSGVSFARPVDRRCGERRCLPDNRYFLRGWRSRGHERRLRRFVLSVDNIVLLSVLVQVQFLVRLKHIFVLCLGDAPHFADAISPLTFPGGPKGVVSDIRTKEFTADGESHLR